MLQWTASGAVSTPRTVQIRLQRRHPERVAVGAPVPVRSLGAEELRTNLRFFTEGMSGPRSTRCTRLVLSGVEIARRPDLPAAIELARQLRIEDIILHCSAEDLDDGSEGLPEVDRLVIPIPNVRRQRKRVGNILGVRRKAWTGLIRTGDSDVNDAEQLLKDALAGSPTELVLSAPFPHHPRTPAPNLENISRWLTAFARFVEPSGLPWRVQGLPACYLGAHRDRTRKAGNRWYVDSEHQLSEALRFFPDVMRFYKSDSCRFCIADTRCDGSFPQWLAHPELPPLEPLT